LPDGNAGAAIMPTKHVRVQKVFIGIWRWPHWHGSPHGSLSSLPDRIMPSFLDATCETGVKVFGIACPCVAGTKPTTGRSAESSYSYQKKSLVELTSHEFDDTLSFRTAAKHSQVLENIFPFWVLIW